MKLYVRAILPPDLVAAFHQHIRDFDTRYDPRHEGKVHVDMVGKSEWPVKQMLEVYEAMSPQPQTMMVAREHYRIWRTPLMRWIVLHPKENVLAWTGSGWAIHKDGVGMVVQISNFPTAEEADAYARDMFGPPENTELKA